MRATSTDRVAIPADAILWHDGLLLAPLHFEQLTQRQEELVAYHVRSGFQYAWGVRRLELQPGRLAQNIVAVSQLEAVMPDGLLVTHGDQHAPLQLVISDVMIEALRAPGARCPIYLAVPVDAQVAGRARLRSVERDDSDLCRVRPNARLVAEADLTPAAEVHLPLLNLKFEKQQLQIEPFLPPLLDIDFMPLDGQSSLRSRGIALYRRLGETERQLAAVAAECGDRLRRLELREQLHCVSSGMPQLGGTLTLDGVTPLQLYMALCHVLGSVAILRNLAEATPDVPPYLHRNPGRTFDTLFGLIDARLDTIERRCTELAFDRNTHGFSLLMDTDMLEGWPAPSLNASEGAETRQVLLVGVRGLSPEQAERWMASATIVSSGQLEDVRERRVRGAARYGIDPSGGLVLLAAEPDPMSAVNGPANAIDVQGLRTAGTALFAVEPEAGLVRAGQKLVIEVQGGAVPDEVVLLVATERKP
ncbi:type VI secretion system baseplate subunit TssK [Pseudoduganella sp. RAF53_2]|uniref:type VI secretion system baseplate subunit TssK n=1 Tax=unclassified Pseudoduganella TaxID=2637179 RepID=UPI003F9DB2D4